MERIESLKRQMDRALIELNDARDRRADANTIKMLEREAASCEAALVRVLGAS